LPDYTPRKTEKQQQQLANGVVQQGKTNNQPTCAKQ